MNIVSRIECIKGFKISTDESLCVMAGEQFFNSSSEETDWTGDEDSRFEGMIIAFTDAQLIDNFKYIGRKHLMH